MLRWVEYLISDHLVYPSIVPQVIHDGSDCFDLGKIEEDLVKQRLLIESKEKGLRRTYCSSFG